MSITGGFGITLDTQTGATRTWSMGSDGVRKFVGSGEPVDPPPVCEHCGEPAHGWSAKDARHGWRFEGGVKVYHCRAAAIAD